MKRMMLMTAGFGLWGGMALAAVDTEALVADLQRQGYTWIEVKRGPTQTEVEAVRGEVKIETVYDTATGRVLDRDTDRASRRERDRSGVEIRNTARDFEDRDDWDDRDDDRDDDRWDDDRDDWDDRYDRDDRGDRDGRGDRNDRGDRGDRDGRGDRDDRDDD